MNETIHVESLAQCLALGKCSRSGACFYHQSGDQGVMIMSQSETGMMGQRSERLSREAGRS